MPSSNDQHLKFLSAQGITVKSSQNGVRPPWAGSSIFNDWTDLRTVANLALQLMLNLMLFKAKVHSQLSLLYPCHLQFQLLSSVWIYSALGTEFYDESTYPLNYFLTKENNYCHPYKFVLYVYILIPVPWFLTKTKAEQLVISLVTIVWHLRWADLIGNDWNDLNCHSKISEWAVFLSWPRREGGGGGNSHWLGHGVCHFLRVLFWLENKFLGLFYSL